MTPTPSSKSVSPTQGAGWRAIETAPKDVGGDLILLRVSPWAFAIPGYWNGKHWCRGPGTPVDPTHWQPMPSTDLPAPLSDKVQAGEDLAGEEAP